MSSETEVTISKALILTISLKAEILQIIQPEGINLIRTFTSSIDKWFGNVEYNEIYSKTAFLDPRFKDKAFKNVFSLENVKDQLKIEIKSLLSEKNDSKVEEMTAETTNLIREDFDEASQNTAQKIQTFLQKRKLMVIFVGT